MARFLAYSLSFAFVMVLLVSWLTPYLLEWYANPAVDVGVNCAPTARWAMDRMLFGQAGGFAIGFVVGMMFWVTRGGRTQPQESQANSESTAL